MMTEVVVRMKNGGVCDGNGGDGGVGNGVEGRREGEGCIMLEVMMEVRVVISKVWRFNGETCSDSGGTGEDGIVKGGSSMEKRVTGKVYGGVGHELYGGSSPCCLAVCRAHAGSVRLSALLR